MENGVKMVDTMNGPAPIIIKVAKFHEFVNYPKG